MLGWGGGKGECALLDSEAGEGFIEKETLEWGPGEYYIQRPWGGKKLDAFKKHTGDQMV